MSTEVADYYRTWSVPTRLTTSHWRTFGSTWVSLRTRHILTMTTQESLKEPYNVLLWDWDQTARSADVIRTQSVLIFYLPDFHMFSWTQSRTITWPPKSYIYYLFLFIGSPVPLLATYTRTMDTKRSGFHHLWLDFYLITFRTHMNIPLAFLSLLFDMSRHPFGTYSHFSFDMLLRGSIYYKNTIYDSGIEQLSHPTVKSSFTLVSTIEIVFANFRKLVLLVVWPHLHSYLSPCSYLLSARIYCQSPMWLLKHVVVGCSTTSSLPTESLTQPTECLVGVWCSPETIRAL